MLGSGVWAGIFTPDFAYARTDLKGAKLGEELSRIGFKGDVPASFDANKLSAHFEVHIEQGPILEAENKPIGVVTGVQAMSWLNVELRGKEQHCGTTPMDRRHDTLLTAAKMIVAINGAAIETPGGLASVAVINSTPQSINTMASHVQFNIDIRAVEDPLLALLEEKVKTACVFIADEAGVEIEVYDKFWTSPRTKFNEVAVGMIRKSAEESGYAFREIQSGAGHDSVYTSKKVPTAMIFIRCKDGVSHNPAEFSLPEDIQAGAQVLLGAVLRYDAYLKSSSS